jgi:hypothetical protein
MYLSLTPINQQAWLELPRPVSFVLSLGTIAPLLLGCLGCAALPANSDTLPVAADTGAFVTPCGDWRLEHLYSPVSTPVHVAYCTRRHTASRQRKWLLSGSSELALANSVAAFAVWSDRVARRIQLLATWLNWRARKSQRSENVTWRILERLEVAAVTWKPSDFFTAWLT